MRDKVKKIIIAGTLLVISVQGFSKEKRAKRDMKNAKQITCVFFDKENQMPCLREISKPELSHLTDKKSVGHRF